MNLGEFVERMNVPTFAEVTKGQASGLVALATYKPGVMDLHTRYMQVLGIVRDHSNSCFQDIVMLAEGVDSPKNSLILLQPKPLIQVMHALQDVGALRITDGQGNRVEWDNNNEKKIRDLTGIQPLIEWYLPNAHYEINRESISRIGVVSARPCSENHRRAFSYFFPVQLWD